MNSKPPALAATSAIALLEDALCSGRLTINALDDGSGVLLDIEGEQLLTLNGTGMHLVRSIESGARGVDELVTALTSGFDVDSARARADTQAFLARLAQALD